MRKVTDNKCEDCYYAVPNEQAIGKYNCHRFPDQLLSVPVQAPNGQIVLQITPARPAAERSCGEFKHQEKVLRKGMHLGRVENGF